MKDYLKNIFSVVLLATIFAVPVHADPTTVAQPEAAAAQADSQPPSSSVHSIQESPFQQTAPSQIAATQAAEEAPMNEPVQTDTIQTDHAQKPTKPLTYYNYAHDEAEYSVSIPEAPTVSTIWLESPETKQYLKQAPTDHAALGEVAILRLVDIDTEESFDVKITFLRATQPFLEGLNEKKIKNMLTKKFSEVSLSNETFNISNGAGTLKWATLSGFVLDAHHHPAFYAIHYLTGLKSILVIQARYNIENKTFQEYYNHLVSSVTYVQP